jgi:cytochrome c-type biogenesis protein CcmE
MILELTQDMNLINPLACFFAADSDTYKEKHAAYFGALPDYFASAQKILGGLKYFGGIII